MLTILGLVAFGAAAFVMSSVHRTEQKIEDLLRELGTKWGLQYQPSPTLGLPELRGIYRSHHVLFQVWPTKKKGKATERRRLVVSTGIPFEGIIRISRRNGRSHMDILGTEPVKTGDSRFDAKFLTSTTDQDFTRSLLTGDIREALDEIQETEVCISSNQVRIYGEGDTVTEQELDRWLNTAIRIGEKIKSLSA